MQVNWYYTTKKNKDDIDDVIAYKCLAIIITKFQAVLKYCTGVQFVYNKGRKFHYQSFHG